jgi:hypothetical protein
MPPREGLPFRILARTANGASSLSELPSPSENLSSNGPQCAPMLAATASRQHQARTPDTGVAEAPHLVCVHSTKSSSRGMIARHTRLRVNCTTSARSIWIVSAAMDSAMSWGRAGSRQSNPRRPRQPLPTSRKQTDGERKMHRMRRLSAPRWNSSIPSACRNSASIPRHSVVVGVVTTILVVLSLSHSQWCSCCRRRNRGRSQGSTANCKRRAFPC